MELRAYLEIIKRRWWLLALGPLVAGVFAFAVTKTITPTYRAAATLLVNETQTPGVVLYNDVLTSERLTNTYAQLVERDPVLTKALTQLNLPITLDDLRDQVSVSTVRQTQILRVAVEDTDPELAARIANTVADTFIQENSSQLSRPGTVSVVEQARVPGAPFKPNLMLNTLLAAILGLVVAGGVAAALEYLDDTVKSPDDVEALLGLPTLGTVTRFRSHKGDSAALNPNELRSAQAETYRHLRTSIQFVKVGSKMRSIVVTSSGPGEGKSTTVANLGIILAQAGNKVIIVDTDLRRPTLHKLLNVSNSFGLTGLLLSETSQASQAVLPTRIKNLAVIPSGPIPPNPSELLSSEMMKSIVESISQRADYVLFDSPPILVVTDASILSELTDASILVVESGRTRSEAVKRAYQALSRAGKRSLGVVLNKATGRRGSYYYYNYRYGSAGDQQVSSREATQELVTEPQHREAS